MCRLVHAFGSGVPANKEPAIRRGPDLASSNLQNRFDEFIFQTFARAEGMKAAVLITQHATAVGCNPKRSIPADRQGANIVFRHARRVEPGVDHKADSVESG